MADSRKKKPKLAKMERGRRSRARGVLSCHGKDMDVGGKWSSLKGVTIGEEREREKKNNREKKECMIEE